ncbi:glycosyltransferase 9 family protein, partial [Vibrio cholerae HC-17A1]
SNNSIVGFQMGASTQERRWPVGSFVELAKKLIDSAPLLQIKLIGSSRELELPEEFFALLPERYHQNIE